MVANECNKTTYRGSIKFNSSPRCGVCLGPMLPLYWLIDTFDATYFGHIATFKTFNGQWRRCGYMWMLRLRLLKNGCLYVLTSATWSSIAHSSKSLWYQCRKLPWPYHGRASDVPTWVQISSNALIFVKLFKLMKVIEVVHIQVLGSVEDERNIWFLVLLEEQADKLNYNTLGLSGSDVRARLLYL